MKLPLSKITLSLIVVLLSVASISAENLIWVNATEVPVHVTGVFTDSRDGTCRSQLNQEIEPGGVFTHDMRGCLLSRVTVSAEGHIIEAGMRETINKGLFVIKPTRTGMGYELEGPYIDHRQDTTILYFVNATGHDMYYNSTYTPRGYCSAYNGNLAMGATVPVVTGRVSWQEPCATEVINGRIFAGHDVILTNSYRGKVSKGTFVFRKKAGTQNQFEVAGPFMQ